ncbi:MULTISPECIES: hypothetical protein [unclassified Streptomyces]|uniref:hypothetical protein n=1 Tax=unclassified Streptomyces TaxID=2593676 RepID=UPI0019078612|nr:hypothetical protein [Streptomyces sp. HSG2]
MRATDHPVGVGALLLLAVLTGCRTPSATPAEGGPPGTAGPATVRPAASGGVFLDRGECGAPTGTNGFAEASCAGGRATALVLARYEGRARAGPACPTDTDFILHLSARSPSLDEDGDGSVPRGYACMRNLRPPHPGDPGGGGGPHTVVGDCVHESAEGRVRETACREVGGPERRYRVTDAVTDRAECPASTTLYVRLGGSRPVGCARPL